MFKPLSILIVWIFFFMGVTSSSLMFALVTPLGWAFFASSLMVFCVSMFYLLEALWPSYPAKHRV